jgi:hypothetical protein
MKYISVFFVVVACIMVVAQTIIVTGRAEAHVPKS